MKKIISLLLVLLIAAGAAAAFYFFYWKNARPLGDLKAAEYVQSDALALVEMTDIPRSKARWKETALYKISQEPEVAAFLQKPESLIPPDKRLMDFARFLNLDPKEVFVAVTGQTGSEPKLVAGFDFKGSQKDAESLVDDLKGELKASFPDGKSDIQKYGADEIETFTQPDGTVATVFHGRWFFASNDVDLLKATLDRVEGKTDVKTSLRDDATYQSALAKLPKDSDAVVFVQMKQIIDTFAMMLSSAPNVTEAQLNEFKKIQAISAAFKLDGENIRDAIYVYKPGALPQAPLARNALAFTSPDTIFCFASALNLDKAPVLPNPALDKSGFLSVIDMLRQTLVQAGLGFDDFKGAFGPEAGTVADWGADSLKPGWVITLDVHDRAKAQKFIETLAVGWPKQAIDGAEYYSFPQAGGGLIPVAPVLALTDKALLFGIDIDSVKKAIQNAASGSAKIDKSADFQAASGLVSKPTSAFGYIDSKVLFERIYVEATNALKMMALFNPHANDYGDLSKLPAAEVISKHLGPIVYSQSVDENGLLIESAGPVTFTEIFLGVGAGVGYVASKQMAGHQPQISNLPQSAPAMPPADQSGTTPASPPEPVPATQ
jgi:hypothetical protein